MFRAALPALACILVQAAPGSGGVSLFEAQAFLPVIITGGNGDDRHFAQKAMGLDAKGRLAPEALESAILAIKATDRFQSVTGERDGASIRLHLAPWSPVSQVRFVGDEPFSFRKVLFPDLRGGVRAGDLRIKRWADQARQLLREAGYPKAEVAIRREANGERVVAEVHAGPPARIRTCEVHGDLEDGGTLWPVDQILGWAHIKPGKTLYSEDLERRIQKALHSHLVSEKRLEGRVADFRWDEASGALAFRVIAGPEVQVKFEGEWGFSWLSWKNRKSFIPLERAISYSPELLNEGDRNILRYLRNEGYLDATVAHRREVTAGSAAAPQKVRIVYTVHPGARVRLRGIRFVRNHDMPESTLRKVASLPKGFLGTAPVATPDTAQAMEDRLRNYYRSLGYPDAVIRRLPMERHGRDASMVFQIQEKAHRMVDRLILELPSDPAWQAWTFAECLALAISDRPASSSAAGTADATKFYRSDRLGLSGVTATLREHADPARPGVRLFTFQPSRPIPYVRNDLAIVFSSLRSRMSALGVQAPVPHLELEGDENATVVRFELADQPRLDVHRLVVQGSDQTRARAVFRETALEPGAPLSPDRLFKAQSNLGNLGVFQTLDLSNFMEASAEERQGREWQRGDLLLRAVENPPWVVTSSFGYDKSQGYHTGLGLQRLNVGGMGRTLDMGIRAGDATIQNPTLRKIFTTGDYDRSVDMYNIGYTDPWFAPGMLEDWLPDRTRFHTEAAYIEEHQDVYLVHRRRMTADLEWRLSNHSIVQTGYRFERDDVKSAVENISQHDLIVLARSPDHSIISAPYVQVVHDTRDSALDPTEGAFTSARFEAATQFFGTSNNSSFLKLDVRQQWHWGLGYRASAGVVTLGVRAGVARPTAGTSRDLPLSERFFAGGPTTHRGLEPDALGPFDTVTLRDSKPPFAPLIGPDGNEKTKTIPLGGQALALINLEYRFPLFSQGVWGEVFVDSGQVYQYLDRAKDGSSATAAFPPFQTALGVGLILKVGLPIKIEYAADARRIFGLPRTQRQRDTQLRGVLISAGFQF